MKTFEGKLVLALNSWYENLESVEDTDFVKYEFAKNKFRTLYLKKTGEFLNITQRAQVVAFNKIAHGLSENFEFTDALLNEYLEWCFDNYDFFLKKRKGFNLNTIAHFAKEWDQDLLKFEYDAKVTYKDLKEVDVKENIFISFETYGIPFAATKLSTEVANDQRQLKQTIRTKLDTLTNTKEDLARLRNMLRSTVENGPYESGIMFHDYRLCFEDLFSYFPGEPWNQ